MQAENEEKAHTILIKQSMFQLSNMSKMVVFARHWQSRGRELWTSTVWSILVDAQARADWRPVSTGLCLQSGELRCNRSGYLEDTFRSLASRQYPSGSLPMKLLEFMWQKATQHVPFSRSCLPHSASVCGRMCCTQRCTARPYLR